MMRAGHTIDAYIALGANLGERLANFRAAVEMLTQPEDSECQVCSSIYETSPVGGPDGQENYFNAVIQLRTSISAPLLLERCLDIERKLGRCRSIRHGPRLIDLDLLLFGDAVISTDNLTIPHPRLHLRRFVLEPLAEIAPQLRHPVMKTSVAELRAALPHDAGGSRRILGTPWPAPSNRA